MLPPAVGVVMSKNKSIFLNTELISELPKRDFIATPEFFPRADVQPGTGALPHPGLWDVPGSGCAGINVKHRERIPYLFRGQGEVHVPPKSLEREDLEWFPDLAPTLRTKGG